LSYKYKINTKEAEKKSWRPAKHDTDDPKDCNLVYETALGEDKLFKKRTMMGVPDTFHHFK
jgi:hypothetical protein